MHRGMYARMKQTQEHSKLRNAPQYTRTSTKVVDWASHTHSAIPRQTSVIAVEVERKQQVLLRAGKFLHILLALCKQIW
jgi:hypothetical protein